MFCMIPIYVKPGTRYGHLKVSHELTRDHGFRIFSCICVCGNEKIVRLNSLRTGNTDNCGCLTGQKLKKLKTVHGEGNSKFGDVFHAMLKRTRNKNNPDYYRYGGRGIVCEWKSLLEFKQDMYASYLKHKSRNPEGNTRLERIDNDGPYSKKNCRWATHSEQARNRRSNHKITFKGKTLLLTEWAERLGIPRSTLNSRIMIYRWPVEKALTIPVRGRV